MDEEEDDKVVIISKYWCFLCYERKSYVPWCEIKQVEANKCNKNMQWIYVMEGYIGM